MMEIEEKPVTLSQLKMVLKDYLIDFYQKVVDPGMERMFEEKFERKIGPLREEMRQGFDDLYKRYETLHDEYTVMNHQLGRLEKKVDRIDLRLGRLELRMDAMEEEISEVKERLSGVERSLIH
jgi:chromosome segregation ATPase